MHTIIITLAEADIKNLASTAHVLTSVITKPTKDTLCQMQLIYLRGGIKRSNHKEGIRQAVRIPFYESRS